ncbi:MAG: hypothetical protein AAGA50_31965, partial [Pseudomonadota bacterium]
MTRIFHRSENTPLHRSALWTGTVTTALSLVLIMFPAGQQTAFAQDATYSADEVSRHFKQLKTRSLKPAGTTRALCIGTRDECNA